MSGAGALIARHEGRAVASPWRRKEGGAKNLSPPIPVFLWPPSGASGSLHPEQSREVAANGALTQLKVGEGYDGVLELFFVDAKRVKKGWYGFHVHAGNRKRDVRLENVSKGAKACAEQDVSNLGEHTSQSDVSSRSSWPRFSLSRLDRCTAPL